MYVPIVLSFNCTYSEGLVRFNSKQCGHIQRMLAGDFITGYLV